MCLIETKQTDSLLSISLAEGSGLIGFLMHLLLCLVEVEAEFTAVLKKNKNLMFTPLPNISFTCIQMRPQNTLDFKAGFQITK